MLEQKEVVLAYKPFDGENRDAYCNGRFLSGHAAVAAAVLPNTAILNV